jgi:hypothetical protein
MLNALVLMVKLKFTLAEGVDTVTGVPLPFPGSVSIKYSARLMVWVKAE